LKARAAFLSAVGARVRVERRRRDLKQVEMAAHVGVSRSYISDVERGRANLSLEVLWHIALCLQLPARDLLPEGLPLKVSILTVTRRRRS